MPVAIAKAMCGVSAVACFLVVCPQAAAETYVLQPDGTGDFPTIQAAIQGAVSGDIVELAAGTYAGAGNRDVDFMGRAVTVRGRTGDPTDVVIDCEGSSSSPHRGFFFTSGEGPASVLQDVTVTNAYVTGHGAAIHCSSSSPTMIGCIFDTNNSDGDETYGGAIYATGESMLSISGCRFTANKAGELSGGRGGAIACRYGADATISDCYFEGNYAQYRGGAIYFDEADGTITNCTITDNSANGGAGIYLRYGAFTLTGCTVDRNRTWIAQGGGLLTYTTDLEITECTFFGNRATAGGAMYVDTETFTMSRSIVANSDAGGGVWYAFEPYRNASISCCDVFNNEGGNYSHIIGDQTGVNDNISVDPLFCDAEAGDFTIYDTSPCAPDSSECGQLIGAHGVNCGTPVEPSSWGRVKSIYR